MVLLTYIEHYISSVFVIAHNLSDSSIHTVSPALNQGLWFIQILQISPVIKSILMANRYGSELRRTGFDSGICHHVCVYAVLQTIERPGICSAVSSTVYYK